MKKIALFALALCSVANAATYEIDPFHANARFAIDHFNTSTNVGGFYGLKGQVEFDKKTGAGSVEVSIPVSSLQTGSEHFTNHLKSADLFDIETHPSIDFKSTKFNYLGKGKFRKLVSVDGDLTLLGQTHPVRLKAKKFNCYDSPMAKAEVCGGDFSATIDRSKWGMNYLVDKGVAKKVRIDIQIEAVKK